LFADNEPAPRTIADAESLATANVKFVSGNPAVKINPASRAVALADGAIIDYDTLLIATGAEARRLSLAGPAAGRVAYLRTFDEALHIRRALQPGRHIAIMGGGFIGLEVAASARNRGADVTVVEAMPRLLSRGVPEDIAAMVEARHRAEGVTVHCSVSVAQIEHHASSVALTLSDGRHLSSDFLLIAIGAVPAVGLAEDAGLAIANGIAVDENLRSSDPSIFAAGDCCSFPLPIYGGRRVRLESWRNAQDQGALAARNMLGANEAIANLPWFWSDQYDMTLQIAGLPDEGVVSVRRDIGDGAFILFHLGNEGRLVAASGVGRGAAVARDIRIAEMLIAKGAKPDIGMLSTPTAKLKTLLSA
jgi:3-phenylpropionate/trans-cinnamate dioxygenase ferredoxin reductase subunit